MTEPFILDAVENPHPTMLAGALAARRDGGDYWRGYLQAMADATGCPPEELLTWMDRNA